MRDEHVIRNGKERLRLFLKGRHGADALAYLRSFTVEKALGPEASNEMLRDQEARRRFVFQLERLAQSEPDDTHDSDIKEAETDD